MNTIKDKEYGPDNHRKGTSRAYQSALRADFVQPLKPHEHWHVDVSYINICGTFYYLCSFLDGCSRCIAHWDIREEMEERDVEIILQKAKEKYPEARPRIISDNGPQFIAKDFKEFIRLSGMTHVRTSPFYPQSNGKAEEIFKERDQKLEAAREQRRIKRQQVYEKSAQSGASGYPLTQSAL